MTISSTRRLFLAGAGAVGGAAALAACGSQKSADEQKKQAEAENEKKTQQQAALPATAWKRMDYDQVPDGGTLKLAVPQMPDNWNYNQSDGALGALNAIRGPMGAAAEVKLAEDGSKTFDPAYVEKAELVSEDPQVVEFRYNPKGVWDDGKPIVVDDLIAQWKASNGSNKEFQIAFPVGWDQIQEIAKGEDEFSGRITYATPYIDWITRVHPDVPASVSASPKAWNQDHVKTPTPSKGPFTVAKIDQTAGVVTLKRNERWWGRAPKLETIIFSVVDQATAPQSFANAEIDMLDIGDGDVLSQAKTRKDAEVQKTNGLVWTHLTMNTMDTGHLLGDVKVREAIARGIDRDAVGRAVVGPLEAPIQLVDNFYFLPGQEGYEDSFGGLDFDQAKAGKLLDEAGWKLEGDKRKKGGKTFDLAIIVPADLKSNSDRARQIQTNLNELGLNISIQTVPGDAYFDDYVNRKQFDMVTFSWGGSGYPMTSSANFFYPKDAELNYTNYADESVGPLLTELKSEFDEAKQVEIANEISRKVAASFVCIPFYATPTIIGLKKGIVNTGAALVETTDWTQVGLAS